MSGEPLAILAGGRATRLGPIAVARPKALIEVAGRPFLDHQLALARRWGIRRVVVCAGYLGALVERHLRETPASSVSPQSACAIAGWGRRLS